MQSGGYEARILMHGCLMITVTKYFHGTILLDRFHCNFTQKVLALGHLVRNFLVKPRLISLHLLVIVANDHYFIILDVTPCLTYFKYDHSLFSLQCCTILKKVLFFGEPL